MWSFRSTPDTSFSEEFLLHSPCCVLVRSFSYTPRGLILVKSFSYTDRTGFSEEFLLHCSGYILVRSFSYTPRVGFSEVFACLTHLELVLVRSFRYTPDSIFGEEFLLH